jgi:hypothetical protein
MKKLVEVAPNGSESGQIFVSGLFTDFYASLRLNLKFFGAEQTVAQASSGPIQDIASGGRHPL